MVKMGVRLPLPAPKKSPHLAWGLFFVNGRREKTTEGFFDSPYDEVRLPGKRTEEIRLRPTLLGARHIAMPYPLQKWFRPLFSGARAKPG